MKHTPVTDKYLNIIDDTFLEIDKFKEDSFSVYYDKSMTIKFLNDVEDNIMHIDFNEIRREFWEACNDFDKIIPLKHVFQIKFASLLNFRITSIDDFGDYFDIILDEKDIFLERHKNSGVIFTEEESVEIERVYISISLELSSLKTKMLQLLDEWHQMGIKSNEHTELIPEYSKFKLAFKKKTDFIKILSAMYDNRMFETEDGYLASSKQDLMNEFGSIVGEDLSNYSVYLSKSKNPEKEVFLKPFKDIEKKAEEYYDKKVK